MASKSNEGNPMEGCPITYPVIDEAQLLADVRSPRFLLACKKLRIDPLELRSPVFESSSNIPHEKKQIRYAMHERARHTKWHAINECRFSLPAGGQEMRPHLRSPDSPAERSVLSNSWIGIELAKTAPIVQKRRQEVFLKYYKTLKDLASNVHTREVQKQTPAAVEHMESALKRQREQRKLFLKKQMEQIQKKKEKNKKLRETLLGKEKALKEQDEVEQTRRAVLLENLQKEVDQKAKAQLERFKLVRHRLAQVSQEREELAAKREEEMMRKEEAIRRRREELRRPSSSPMASVNLTQESVESQHDKGAAARYRREQAKQRAADHARQLLAEFKKEQQRVEQKAIERSEKEKESTKVGVVPSTRG